MEDGWMKLMYEPQTNLLAINVGIALCFLSNAYSQNKSTTTEKLCFLGPFFKEILDRRPT